MSHAIGTIIGGTAGFLVGGPAGAAIGASIGSGVDSSRAASDAADAQVQSANDATAEARRQYGLTREDQAPYRQAGAASLAELMKGVGAGGAFNRNFTLADFTADPGYQFRLSEGEKGIERAAAAHGGLYSGATLKALARFNQDTASQEYGNAYNRYNNDMTTRFNRLASLAGIGQTATNMTDTAGINTSSQIGQNMIGAGNARASGYVGSANAINNGLSQYLNYSQNQNLLSKLARQNQFSIANRSSDPLGSFISQNGWSE